MGISLANLLSVGEEKFDKWIDPARKINYIHAKCFSTNFPANYIMQYIIIKRF